MPKLLFLVTEDWYFHSHRFGLARAAARSGYDVVLLTRVGADRAAIEAAGIRVRALGWRRGRFSVWRELKAFVDICRVYREEVPDLVHHVALKPVIYGSLALRFTKLARQTGSVNAIAGLGYSFISRGVRGWLLRYVMRMVLAWALRFSDCVLVQNPDDRETVDSITPRDTKIRLIPGSGVDEQRFPYAPEPPEAPLVVTVVARMLWDKGIGEVVEASRVLREREPPLEFRLIGSADDANAASIPAATLKQWEREGLIIWMGHRDDIPSIWKESHIAVLPSYREGLPKSLLEAASSGRAMVTTDVPGCRDVVEHGVNGILVPVRDPSSLAAAIETLAADRGLRERLGNEARRIVMERFTERAIVAATLVIYEELLGVASAR